MQYRAFDGEDYSEVVSVQLTVNAVNDRPTVAPTWVQGLEDQIVLLKWSDFAASDVEADPLSLRITSLPAEGQLQSWNGQVWLAVTVGQRLTKTDLDQQQLRFVPDANASSSLGYDQAGLGNLHHHYAQLQFVAEDAQLDSMVGTLTLDIVAVADQPTLNIAASIQQQVVFQTSWEAASNPSSTSTLLAQSSFDGWQLVTQGDRLAGGNNGFEIWSNQDQMEDSTGTLRSVSADLGNGQHWLELNDAGSGLAQTLGIKRSVQTVAGAQYSLSFDYAGRLGFSNQYTQIGIYVDGQRIASYANTSSNTALNWQAVNSQFVGNGQTQTIQILIEAPCTHAGGRGAMIDDIQLIQTQQFNRGLEDQAILLSQIQSQLQDLDGSEHLNLAIAGLPLGSRLSDGVHQFVSTEQQLIANVSDWDINHLSFTAPAHYSGNVTLQVISTSIEVSNGSRATAIQNLPIEVIASVDTPNLTLQSSGAYTSRELINTSWEGAWNWTTTSTGIVGGLEGWCSVSGNWWMLPQMEVWSAGDYKNNSQGQRIRLGQAPQGNNWLQLHDGAGKATQNMGIERSFYSMAGAIYTLDLNYAGDLGLSSSLTGIGIYVDGIKIASYTNTSSNTALDWKAINFQFIGAGGCQDIRIQLEGSNAVLGRSIMIDALRLTESIASTDSLAYVVAGSSVQLPQIVAGLQDQDGSEHLQLALLNIPNQVMISDGVRQFVASSCNNSLDLQGWDISRLSISVPQGYCHDIALTVRATATEQSTGQQASTEQTITIRVLSGIPVSTPVTVNPYVSTTQNDAVTPTSSQYQLVSQATLLSQASILLQGTKTNWEEEQLEEAQQIRQQSQEWLEQLEQLALQNW